MNKKYWHHIWTTRVRPIKVWYLVALTAISALVCVGALRNNNQTMGDLRSNVYSADKNDGDVVNALQKLQAYVTTHMNTSLVSGENPVYPPIQLQYTYQRLQDEAKLKAAAANATLYSQAQAYCEQQNPTDFSGRNRVPCIEQYVTSRGGQKAAAIPDSMYKFNFASPRWSPDLAGWTLLLTILLGIVTLFRIAAGWLLKRFTK